MIYDKIKRNQNNIVDIKNKVLVSYINGPKVEILGSYESTYRIEFIDKKTNIRHFESELKTNHWGEVLYLMSLQQQMVTESKVIKELILT